MLYLDSSALIKGYVHERGSDALRARLHAGERIFTSILSYAEIHAVLGRKCQRGELGKNDYRRVRERFEQNWLFSLNVLEVDVGTLAAVPWLAERYELRGAHLVHLSSALWLRDMLRVSRDFGPPGETLEFGVSDRRLGRIARDCGLAVFDPEKLE